MLNGNNKLDPKITQHATQALAAGGIRSPSRVNVVTAAGVVTIKGTIQYAHQRQAAMRAVRGIEGVRSVIDQLQVLPPPPKGAVE